MTVTPATMDEAVLRIQCYAVGTWLEQTLAALGLSLPVATGTTLPVVMPCVSGLVLRVGIVEPDLQLPDPRDRFYLLAIEGDAGAPMPLGLDARTETIASAKVKLSSSIVGGSPAELSAGDRRVSFFMDGGRVVELRFTTNLIGFDRVLVARLGEALDWRDPASR